MYTHRRALVIVGLLGLSAAAPVRPLAVIEPDPISHGPNCQIPMRLRNLTNSTITVTVERKWWQYGVGCNVTGETVNMPPIGLNPLSSSYLGCSKNTSVNYTCIDNNSFRYVDALERIVVQAAPPQKKKKKPTRPEDNGPRH